MNNYKGNDITHNLFDYATSELSQDAFFCWLLSYSTKESKQDHSDLFKVSQRFLKRMLNEKIDNDDVDYYVTNIERQKKAAVDNFKGYIDIFVMIETAEDKCYLIIEDKVDTWEHNQLEVYYKAVLEELKKKSENHNKLYVAFVKTEYMIHMEEEYMEKFKDSEIQHLKIMKQDELCEILDEEEASASNVILNDFVKKLKRKINRETFDIERLDDEDFGKESTLVYKFFDYLIQNKLRSQDQRKDSFCWCGYVNNARGGFHCLTWDEYKFDKKPFASMYLQMEVYPYDGEKSELRIALKLRAFEESDEDSALSSNQEPQIKELKNAINEKIQDIKDKAVFRYETKYFRMGHTMRAGYVSFDIKKYEEAMLQMETYIEEAVKVLSEN